MSKLCSSWATYGNVCSLEGHKSLMHAIEHLAWCAEQGFSRALYGTYY